MTAVVVLLLAIGVASVLLCCGGLLAMRDPFDRLHCLGPATIVGASATAAAVFVQEPFSQSGVKAVLVAVLLIATAPVLSHATAQAIYQRRTRQDAEGRETEP